MSQCPCHRPESLREKAVLAMRWRGAPLQRTMCASSALTGLHAKLFSQGETVPRRTDASILGLLAGTRLTAATNASMASRSGPSWCCAGSAWADAGDAAWHAA
jgi:hypothetical protein